TFVLICVLVAVLNLLIKLIDVAPPPDEDIDELLSEHCLFRLARHQSQVDSSQVAHVDLELITSRSFSSHPLRIDGVTYAVDDKIVDTVFDILRKILSAEDSFEVGFVLGEEQFRGASGR